MAPTGWIIVAFVTAIVVLVIAATSSAANRRGLRQFLADLRVVPRRGGTADGVALPAGTRWEPLDEEDDREGGVRDLFQVGEVPTSAYVDPPAIPEPIARMTRSLVSRVRS